jgi:hypothetical protein
MKRSVLALILVLGAFFAVYGQNTPMDLVLILDTSSGMGSSYENVSNYITGPFLSEYLRAGDTFHLITFSGSPRLDIARRITDTGDVETIIGRMLIQYPIESGSNLSSAISFAELYIASLPARAKKIVIVSTGGGDTNNLVGAARQRLSSRNVSVDFVQVSPGQPLANLPSSGRPGTSAPAASVAATTPSTTAPAATTPSTTAPAAVATAPSTTTPAATTPSTTAPAATTPAATTPSTTAPAATTPSTTAPAAATPSTTAPVAAPASPPAAQQSQGTTPAASATPQPSTGTAVQATPETGTSGITGTAAPNTGVSETGNTGISATGPSEDTGRPAVESQTREPERETVTPSQLPPEEQEKKSSTAWTSSLPFIIGIIILALIILGIIVFFATRRLGSSPNRVVAQAASTKPESRDDKTPFADHSKDLAKYAAGQNRQRSTPYADRPAKTESVKQTVINPSGPLLLNLFVEDQNTAIGKRNIHSLKSGYSLSVGGGQSDFLIFLVPVPANIGEIRRDGSQCSFIPKKPKYFPDLGSNELRDCINKTIRVISDKNYELRFRFEMYEDPLVELNRVLRSVSVPG